MTLRSQPPYQPESRERGVRMVGEVPVMVQLAGIPRVTGANQETRVDGAVPEMLRIQVGPVMWEVCDATTYASALRAWR